MKSNSSNGARGGIGFFGLLTIAFVVLKLVGVIHWKWVWVLAPAWISVLIVLVIFVVWALLLVGKKKR